MRSFIDFKAASDIIVGRMRVLRSILSFARVCVHVSLRHSIVQSCAINTVKLISIIQQKLRHLHIRSKMVRIDKII